MNQFMAIPFSDVGNTQQRKASSAIYRLTWVTYASICSSGSVLPSYLSFLRLFHVCGSNTSIISSERGVTQVKGCLRDDNPNVLLEVVCVVLKGCELFSPSILDIVWFSKCLWFRCSSWTFGVPPPHSNFLFTISFSSFKAFISSVFFRFLLSNSLLISIMAI